MIPIPALLAIGTKLLDRFIPDPAVAAKAKAELEQMATDGRLEELGLNLKADQAEQDNLTARHQADMGSDSWLSKNIRPLTLIAIFMGYFTFAMMSAFGHNANESYVQLLGQWGMLVMSFYFGGRTLEKIMDMRAKR